MTNLLLNINDLPLLAELRLNDEQLPQPEELILDPENAEGRTL